MANARMPDEFYDLVAHHLPPEPPRVGPRGGRPWIGHRAVMRVIWYVLASGVRWADVPAELGCSGRTAHRRLRAWEEAGVWDRLHADLLRLLRQADKLDTDLVVVDGVSVRAFGGGEQTGPSPVDRSRPGTKHTLMVSRSGVPLAIRTAGANASDHTQIIPLVLDFPAVGGKPGRPKELPDELYADRGYDSEATRWILRWLGVEPHIAKRRTPHGSGLGKIRWVVERTISWLKGLRDAGPVRPAAGHPGRLDVARRQRHLLPDLERRVSTRLIGLWQSLLIVPKAVAENDQLDDFP